VDQPNTIQIKFGFTWGNSVAVEDLNVINFFLSK